MFNYRHYLTGSACTSWSVCSDVTGYECMCNLAQKHVICLWLAQVMSESFTRIHTHTHTHKHTHTRVRTLLKCVWPEDQGSPCQRGGINGFICVCECVCVGMFMLLSANSSSAACPAPCKDQTPCLLEERQKPEWLCFLYSAIKKWHERLADRHPRKRLWPLHGLLAPARWLLHQKQTNKKC